MSDRVNINDPDQLDKLAYALERYRSGVEQVMRCAQGDIAQTLGYLGERYSHWRRQFDAWRGEADRLESQFRRCMASASESRNDRRSSGAECAELGAAWREASRRRDLAESNVRTADGLIRSVQQAEETFRRESNRFQRDLSDIVPTASAGLKQKAARTRDVAAHRFSGGVLAGRAAAAVAGTIFTGAAGGGAPASNAAGGPGLHSGSPGEGQSREKAPNPEGLEGPVRLPVVTERSSLEPPEGWSPDPERG